MNQFPWWFHKLLLHYIPSYIVLLLEQPWIAVAIMSGFTLIALLAISFSLYYSMQERKKRKKLEAEHALLLQRYEQLKHGPIIHSLKLCDCGQHIITATNKQIIVWNIKIEASSKNLTQSLDTNCLTNALSE